MIHINENLHNVVTDKTKVTFTIDKTLMNRFRQVANKDMRKYSTVIQRLMMRYCEGK